MKTLLIRVIYCVLVYGVCASASAQVVDPNAYTVNVFSTNGFGPDDKVTFLEYISNASKISQKSSLTINFISLYSGKGFISKPILSLDGKTWKGLKSKKNYVTENWNESTIKEFNSELNAKYKDEAQLISEIQVKRLDQNIDLSIYSDVSTFPFNGRGKPISKKNKTEIVDLISAKWANDKRNGAAREINIFYDKAFREYVFSEERMMRCYENYQNGNLYKMRPEFLNVEEYTQLRPQGSVGGDNPYIIRFDSVGFFDSYELAIYRTGTNDVLFKERIDFSNDDPHFQLNYTGEGRVCEISIMAKHLGMLCYGNFPDANLNAAPDVTDCGPCSLECLYKKSWDVQIRGCVEGVSREKLWTERVKRVEFQCPNKSY